jgi:hypothetical protein
MWSPPEPFIVRLVVVSYILFLVLRFPPLTFTFSFRHPGVLTDTAISFPPSTRVSNASFGYIVVVYNDGMDADVCGC